MKNMQKLRRIAKALCVIGIAGILALLPLHAASAVSGTIANVVVCLRFAGDGDDAFTPAWDTISAIYDDPSYSFKSYLSAISNGQVSVNNVFAQSFDAQSGQYSHVITLENDASAYSDDSVIAEIVRRINSGSIVIPEGASLSNLDGGFVDNITLLFQHADTSDTNSNYYPHAHETLTADTFTYGGAPLRFYSYNVLNTGKLIDSTVGGGYAAGLFGGRGVVSHEFMHTLGFNDLYYYSGSGSPVGVWDIMASTSNYLQYPLTVFRARQGWASMTELSPTTAGAAGTHTLNAVTVSAGAEGSAIKVTTPLSTTEYFVIENRYNSNWTPADPLVFDGKVPESGLIVYRIDTTVSSERNAGGENYAYVFRPDYTQANSVETMTLLDAALSGAATGPGEPSETSYGTTNLNDGVDKGTIHYANGDNSGIAISDVVVNGTTATFTLSFADYTSENLWALQGGGNVTAGGGDSHPDVSIARDNAGTTYAASCEGTSTLIRSCSDGAWTDVATLSGLTKPQLRFYGGALYLIGTRNYNEVLYYKLEGGAFQQTRASQSANDPQYLRFVESAAGLLASYVSGNSQTGTSLVITDVLSNSTISDTLSGIAVTDPAVCKLGSDYYALYSDYNSPVNPRIPVVKKLSGGTWNDVPGAFSIETNRHYLATDGTKLLALLMPQGGGAPLYTAFDGTNWSSGESVGSAATSAQLLYANGPYVISVGSDKQVKTLSRSSDGTWSRLGENVFSNAEMIAAASDGSNIYVVGVSAGSASVRYHALGSSTSGGQGGGSGGGESGGGGGEEDPTPSYVVRVTPPGGYTDTHLWIDGIEHGATVDGGTLSVDLVNDGTAKTAIMYSYKDTGAPNGMYVWALQYGNHAYTATAVPALQDILSYHGFSVRVVGLSGIRFKTGIAPETRNALTGGGLDGYRLVEYGTLSMFSSDRATYPMIKGGANVWQGRAYWSENGRVTDKIFETKAGRHRFTSVLIDIPAAEYATDFAFRGYIILSKDGAETLLYGPIMARSIYRVSQQVIDGGEFAVGSSADAYLRSIIATVESGG